MQTQSICPPWLGSSDAMGHREKQSATQLHRALAGQHQGQGAAWMAGKSTKAKGSQVTHQGGMFLLHVCEGRPCCLGCI